MQGHFSTVRIFFHIFALLSDEKMRFVLEAAEPVDYFDVHAISNARP